jgi:hypothetical protein
VLPKKVLYETQCGALCSETTPKEVLQMQKAMSKYLAGTVPLLSEEDIVLAFVSFTPKPVDDNAMLQDLAGAALMDRRVVFGQVVAPWGQSGRFPAHQSLRPNYYQIAMPCIWSSHEIAVALPPALAAAAAAAAVATTTASAAATSVAATAAATAPTPTAARQSHHVFVALVLPVVLVVKLVVILALELLVASRALVILNTSSATVLCSMTCPPDRVSVVMPL